MPIVLAIAAIDNSGGAGLLQDARAAGNAGCRLVVAVTGNTLQTDAGMEEIVPTETAFFIRQIRRLREAFPIAAVKIGALCSSSQPEAMVTALAGFPRGRIVWDPVIAASKGRCFLGPAGLRGAAETLLPHIGLLTPNLPEMTTLSATLGISGTTPQESAHDLARRFGCGVFLKGGHGAGKTVEEALFLPQRATNWEKPRQPWAYARGTGCMVSTLIACQLSAGKPYGFAVRTATTATSGYFDQLNRSIQR